MKCPVCDVEMAPKGYGPRKDVMLDHCTRCGGTWLDEGELDRLDECSWSNIEDASNFRPAPEDASRDLTCPRCQGAFETLVPEDSPQIEVDRCRGCRGFWLDDNEMTRWLLSRVL